jgi:ribonuclease P protein component
MLPLQNRLKKKEDFDIVYRYGKSLFCDKIVLRVKENHSPVMRMGISIGIKSIKKAVARNRLKRQIRAFFRKNLENICDGIDIVVIVQKGWNEKNTPEKTLLDLLEKGGLYNKK